MTDFVFFDAGETLLGPDPSWSDLAADVLLERGHSVPAERIRDAWADVGWMFEEAAATGERFSLSPEASRTFWLRLYRRQMDFCGVDDEGAPQALYDTFSNPASYRLFADTRPALDGLRERGIRLGVISNFEPWLRDLLGRLGVLDTFEVVVISGEVGMEKPDHEIFHHALERSGTDPACTVHIGDSPAFDAQAATEVGIRGVLLDRHGRHDETEHTRVSALTDLLSLV